MTWFGPFLFLAFAGFGAWAWRRARLKVPGFVHALGLVGLATGLWLAYMDWSMGELTVKKMLLELTIMPLLVYVGFFAYSGRLRVARTQADPPDRAV